MPGDGKEQPDGGEARGSPAGFKPPPRSPKAAADGPETIEIVARHAIQGKEIQVTLPRRAKFKHIKRALVKTLGSDDILQKGQLMKRVNNVYTAYKDSLPIGDVRQVLVVCADFNIAENAEDATLNEGDLSADEVPEAKPSAASRKGAAVPANRSAIPGVFTLKQAVALQRELYDGFVTEEFQDALAALEDQVGSGERTQIQFVQDRQELFLTVQRPLLPKYGFEGSQQGVFKMMGAMGPFLKDPEFKQLAADINEVLRIDSPPETWKNLSKACKDQDAEPPPKKGQPKRSARGARGLGGLGGLGSTFPSLRGLGGALGGPPLGAIPGAITAGPANAASSDADVADAPVRQGGAAPAAGGRGSKAQAQAPEPPAEAGYTEEELGFKPWPPGRRPPCDIYIAGSWDNYRAAKMEWQDGMFAASVLIGESGSEQFQLLQDGNFKKAIYPSIPDACTLEEHDVCGPDGKGHGKNWVIGKFEEEQAEPGAQFLIIAVLDLGGSVRLVQAQLL
mmetsp:Transcript_86097/g.191785  ORF Transcript_86097/g.191785 Transcript_86097/m.191785 type:complete len:508 (-) Transcript_86097:101-1624(-)